MSAIQNEFDGPPLGRSSRLRDRLTDLRQNRHLMDAGLTFVVRVASAFVGYGLQIYLARVLDIAEYGIYATLWTWLIVANHVSVLGFSETAIRFVPRYTSRNRVDWALGFLKTGFTFVLCGALSVGWLIASGLYLFQGIIPDQWLIPIAVVAIGLPVMALDLYMEGVARSFGWYMLTIIPQYIIRPAMIAAGVTLFWLNGWPIGAATVLGIAAGVTALALTVQALILRHRIKKLYGDVVATGSQRFWVTTSLPLAIVVTCEEVFFWSDLLILGFLVTSPEISIYFAALRSMALATFIQYAFVMVTARNFSLASAARDKVQLQQRVTQATNWTFGLTFPAVLLTLIIGYPLLYFFGPAFQAGYPVMWVMGIGLILRSSVGQAVDLLTVMGYQRTNLFTALGGLASNIILSMILVPYFGIMGAAMGTALTYGLRAIFLTFIVWRLAGIWVLPGGRRKGAVAHTSH